MFMPKRPCTRNVFFVSKGIANKSIFGAIVEERGYLDGGKTITNYFRNLLTDTAMSGKKMKDIQVILPILLL